MKVKIGYKVRADSNWVYETCRLPITDIAHEIARLLKLDIVQISLKKVEDKT